MAYTTAAEMEKMIPSEIILRLSDDDADGSADTYPVAEAIDTAADEIDAYIGSRIALPISGTIPNILRKINQDIAIYNLFSRGWVEVPDIRQTRYDNAIRMLRDFAAGKITLGLQPEPDAPETSGQQAVISARTKIFDTTTMGKY